MKFFDEEKDRVEMQTSSLNKSSGSGVVRTVTNYVTGSVEAPNNVTKSGGYPAKKERHWKPCLACKRGWCHQSQCHISPNGDLHHLEQPPADRKGIKS